MQDYKNYIEKKRDWLKGIIARMDFKNGSDEELNELIKQLEEEFGFNPYIAVSKAMLLERQKKIPKAISILKDNLTRYPFHYFSHYYLMILSMQIIDVEKAFYYYAYALRYRECDNDIEDLSSYMEDFKGMLLKSQNAFYIKKRTELKGMLDRIQNEKDYTAFPFDENRKVLVRQKMFEGRTDDDYFLNLYKTHNDFCLDVDDKVQWLLRYEMFKGEYVDAEKEIENNEKDIIAVSPVDSSLTLSAELENGNVIAREDLYMEGFHYFKFREEGKMKLRSDAPFFVSQLKPRIIPDKPRLVMYIFVDGLSFKFLKENNFEKTMPNLYKFFSQGYIADNCFGTAEWTQPTVTTMTTGKYTQKHAGFSADWNYDVEMHHKMMQDYFHEEGYTTARICNNWRLTPLFGYYKNADRIVYAPMRERMHCEEVVMETIGHLETFKDFYNFLWVTIEDLHIASDAIDNNPLVSLYEDKVVSNGWEAREIVSVFKDYSDDGTNYYLAEMRKVDFYLGLLFDYISDNYSNDEILLLLNSDHGQIFLSPDKEMLKEDRTNVAFMLRGKGLKPVRSSEIISNVDVLPTLLHLCGIPLTEPADGKVIYDLGGERREFAYTEVMFRDQYYSAAINDKDHVFHFKSKSLTKPDGGLSIFDYDSRLIDKATGEDVTELMAEKNDYYKALVYEHVKTWIYI